jgi:polyisoprenoid-binding protein YceI
MSQTETSPVLTAAAGVQTWTIDRAHTHVEFAVKHLMIATVKGRFADVAGSVAFDPDQPERGQANVTITVDSIDTREPKRDAHLRSPDFFDAATFPTMQFTSRRIQGDARGRFTLVGDLTIRGTTREIALDVVNEGRVSDPWGAERLGFSATGRLNRSDYGLTWNVALEAGGVLVGDEVRIVIEMELVRDE